MSFKKDTLWQLWSEKSWKSYENIIPTEIFKIKHRPVDCPSKIEEDPPPKKNPTTTTTTTTTTSYYGVVMGGDKKHLDVVIITLFRLSLFLSGMNYSVAGFEMILTRKISFYVVTYYLPSALFVVVSWISFLVNPEVIPGKLSYHTYIHSRTQVTHTYVPRNKARKYFCQPFLPLFLPT